MKKYVFCFITLVLCLTPVFSQETDSLEPYNEPFVEEKVIGFTPSLRFSLLGLEPGVAVQPARVRRFHPESQRKLYLPFGYRSLLSGTFL